MGKIFKRIKNQYQYECINIYLSTAEYSFDLFVKSKYVLSIIKQLSIIFYNCKIEWNYVSI